jgi:hypothetical protein
MAENKVVLTEFGFAILNAMSNWKNIRVLQTYSMKF